MSTSAQDRLKILAAGLRRATKHPHDSEAIHKLRVAIRRFTQSLRIFKDSFERTHVRKMRKRLRRLMDLSGTARNCDIAIDVLEAAGVPADKALRRKLHHMRSQAEGDLVKRLKGNDTDVDIPRWKDWIKGPAKAPPDLLQKLERDFSALGNAAARAGATAGQIHEFRLRVKRYRYTLEILGGSKRHLDRLRRVQDRLGAISDCATTAELIDACGVKAAELRRIKAALNLLQEHRTSEFRLYWRQNKA